METSKKMIPMWSIIALACVVIILFIYLIFSSHNSIVTKLPPNIVEMEQNAPSTNISDPAPKPLTLQEKLAKIHNGMTESEVIAIMGAPNDRLDNYIPGFQNLFYRSGDFERVVRLQNGKVFDIMDPND